MTTTNAFHTLNWRTIMFLFFDAVFYDEEGKGEKRRAYVCVSDAYFHTQPPHFSHVQHVYPGAGNFDVRSGETDEEEGGQYRLAWAHTNGATTFPEESVTAIRLARD